jgi:hypothetical protein
MGIVAVLAMIAYSLSTTKIPIAGHPAVRPVLVVTILGTMALSA